MELLEELYSSTFDWHRQRKISNLKELANLDGAGEDPLIPSFPSSLLQRNKVDEISDALCRSILLLSTEAIHVYILGYFQSCVLTCGAVFERVLKLEYRRKHGELPEGRWTLGKCIHKLDWNGTSITQDHIDKINKFLGPRNSRAHALLEHEQPKLAMMGGLNRGVEVRSNQHYLIEPFRGEAKEGMEALYSILSSLYDSDD